MALPSLPGFNLPGLTSLPPISSSSSSSAGPVGTGSLFSASGGGDWIINQAGGPSVQAGGSMPWVLLAGAAVVIVWLSRRR